MILADTSIWIDHLRSPDPILTQLLETRQLLMHTFIFGEIALGHLDPRAEVLLALNDLPKAIIADDNEATHLIETERLFGTGVGYVDVHLLASTRLTHATKLWTRDRRLRFAAERLGVAAWMTQ